MQGMMRAFGIEAAAQMQEVGRTVFATFHRSLVERGYIVEAGLVRNLSPIHRLCGVDYSLKRDTQIFYSLFWSM